MLKRNITYEDFNGNTITEVFYFNLTKSELVEMDFEQTEGFSEMIKRIIEEKDNRKLIKTFKKLILAAYGEKSADGKRFEKNGGMLGEAFAETAAYDALFIELATVDDALLTFIKGALPSDMSAELENTVKTPEAMIKEAEEAVANDARQLIPPPPQLS